MFNYNLEYDIFTIGENNFSKKYEIWDYLKTVELTELYDQINNLQYQ